MHGQEVGKFNKRKDHKSESNAHTFHSCTITHCIGHMFSYLKKECRVKKGLTPDKSFRKTFEEKEGNLKKIRVFKSPNPN